MTQQPPPRPPRAARHRASVTGPPPGVDPGTGYNIPTTSTAPLNLSRISSPLSPRNIARNAPRRVDPNLYDPIDEPIRIPRSARDRRLQGAPSTGTPIVFYPSSGTVSSDTSLNTRSEDQNEPVPFFRTDPFGTPRNDRSRRSGGASEESHNRTASMRSSGVLGDGAMEVDSDSTDTESVSSFSSVERQIVRQVSTVRRGQAQIVRNPSQRRSVIPDVAPLKPASPPPQMAPPDPPSERSERRMSRLAPVPPTHRLSRNTSHLSAAASSVYSQPSYRAPSPAIPLPDRQLSTSSHKESLSGFARAGVTPSASTENLGEHLDALSEESDVSSIYGSSNGTARKHRPPPLNIPAAVEANNLRSSSTSLPDLLDRATRLHDVLSTGRTTSMLAIDELASAKSPQSAPLYPESAKRADARNPYIREPYTREITAVPKKIETQPRETQKAKPTVILVPAKQAPPNNAARLPEPPAESVPERRSPDRRSPVRRESGQVEPKRGEILESFPTPAKTWPRPTETRGSWPLNWPISRPVQSSSPESMRDPASGAGTALGQGIVSQRTTDTPSPSGPPNRGCFACCCFGKYDPGDRTPTGRLINTPVSEREKDGSNDKRRRPCCGLPLWLIILLLLLIVVIIVAAIVTPIIVLQRKNSSSPAADTSVANCQTRLPCFNNGASIVINSNSQCGCLCAGGFTGMQCQTQDSSCSTISSSGANNSTSIGSAIPQLVQTANNDFSSQFTLSTERLLTSFAAANLSCTAQNALVNLNGSTSGNLANVGALPDTLANVTNGAELLNAISIWSTTTITTIITQTFTTTVPFVNTSSTSFTATTQITTVTSTFESSTFSMTTTTATPTASPSTVSPNGLSAQSLVFGRCVILAVVQDSGVSAGAGIQVLLQSAVNQGQTLIHDNSSGLTIDLLGEKVNGLSG